MGIGATLESTSSRMHFSLSSRSQMHCLVLTHFWNACARVPHAHTYTQGGDMRDAMLCMIEASRLTICILCMQPSQADPKGKNKLSFCDGREESLVGKCIYFVRTNPKVSSIRFHPFCLFILPFPLSQSQMPLSDEKKFPPYMNRLAYRVLSGRKEPLEISRQFAVSIAREKAKNAGKEPKQAMVKARKICRSGGGRLPKFPEDGACSNWSFGF